MDTVCWPRGQTAAWNGFLISSSTQNGFASTSFMGTPIHSSVFRSNRSPLYSWVHTSLTEPAFLTVSDGPIYNHISWGDIGHTEKNFLGAADDTKRLLKAKAEFLSKELEEICFHGKNLEAATLVLKRKQIDRARAQGHEEMLGEIDKLWNILLLSFFMVFSGSKSCFLSLNRRGSYSEAVSARFETSLEHLSKLANSAKEKDTLVTAQGAGALWLPIY